MTAEDERHIVRTIGVLPPEYRVRMAELALQGYRFSFSETRYNCWTADHSMHYSVHAYTLLTLIDKLVFPTFEPAGPLPDAAKSAPAALPVTTN